MLLPLLFTAASFALPATCESLEARASAVIDTKLYAYGADAIGGLPIVNINGFAYISKDPTDSQTLNACDVHFTFTNGTLKAMTNNEELLVAVPDSGDVQFVAHSDDESLKTTGFGWYGQSLYVSSADGQVQTLFSAEPTEETGVYRIGWNVSGAAPLDIRHNTPTSHGRPS